MDNPDLIKNILSIIPPLSFSSHKGQAGRIGIVGGSVEYSGAPFFAAISALKVGCDLVHVFCSHDSSPVIKSYSPEPIVHPILDASNAIEQFSEWLPRLHSLVIGPGLGRSSSVFEITRNIIALARSENMPIVIDADGVQCITQNPDIIKGYKKAILTPNRVEFKRLSSSINIASESDTMTEENEVKALSSLLGNVTICKKGPHDIISDGNSIVVCKEPGSPRRCGGQGDLHSGSMGVFNYWAHNNVSVGNASSMPHSAAMLAALAACMLTRKCSWLAFQKCHRSMTTSDMILEIRSAFPVLFPVE